MQALLTKAWNLAKSVSPCLPCAAIFAALLTAAPSGLLSDLFWAKWFWGVPWYSYGFQEARDGDSHEFYWVHLFFDLFFWILFLVVVGFGIRAIFRKFGFTVRPSYSVCIAGVFIGALYVCIFRPDQLINLETGGYLSFLETPAEQMHLAIWPGDAEKIQTLLKKHPDLVSSTNMWGDTPLQEAAYYGHCNIIRILLSAGADVRSKDGGGRTPFALAVYCGYLGAAELLLKSGADINGTNNYGETPLFSAAKRGDERITKWLLANRAEVNVRDKWGSNPLYGAVMKNSLGTVELLIASNAEVNVKDNEGETPLTAAMDGQKGIVALLLANKADPNVKTIYYMTPLKIASKLDRDDIVQLLKQYGATNN